MTKPQYAGRWARHSRNQRATNPQCEWCGTTADLVTDHLIAGRPEFGTRTLCRPDNDRAARGATGPRRAVVLQSETTPP